MIIHFVLDSVILKGKGFKMHVKESQKVAAGELLFEVDVDLIRPLIPSLMMPVLITNLDGQSVKLIERGGVISKTPYKFKVLDNEQE